MSALSQQPSVALARVGSPAELARASIEHHSKSFALASKLLPPDARLDAQVLYAYCRHVDDAVDEVPAAEQPGQLGMLRTQLDGVYAVAAGGPIPQDPLIAAFTEVTQRRRIPRTYFDELLLGMEMDVLGVDYTDRQRLLTYCYRVAGTVGLMMCHVMGVREPGAITHAAHLGIAMQLTNISRDVLEDWGRGRLYLPDDLLAAHGVGGLRASLGGDFPPEAAKGVAAAIESLLDLADGYYASGDAGVRYLSTGCGIGVRTARLVYSGIGDVLRARGCDPLLGRAYVSTRRKLWLALRAALRTWAELPARYWRSGSSRPATPETTIEDMGEVLWLRG